MIAVEMPGIHPVVTNKELRSTGIATCMSHRENPSVVELILPIEFTFNGIARSTGACAIGTASLHYEIRNNPVENQPIVIAAFGQFYKIGYRIRGILFEEVHLHYPFLRMDFCFILAVLRLVVGAKIANSAERSVKNPHLCRTNSSEMEHIRKTILESAAIKSAISQDEQLLRTTGQVIGCIIHCYRNSGKVLFCGNGGSAADAQHLAAELSGRFYYDRPPLSAEALHVNTSYLTAVANDYSYHEIFARLLKGAGKPGDVLIGISTSGNSPNIIRAFEVARDMGITTVAMTGETGGKMKPLSDFLLNVPSSDTPRIQEAHIMLGHIICEHVESTLFPR